MPRVDRDAQLDEQVVAHALMGRIQQQLHADAEAAKQFYRVRELWQDQTRAPARIGLPGEDGAIRSARLVRALDAVGEATFYAAEREAQQSVGAVALPLYRGSRASIRFSAADDDAKRSAAERQELGAREHFMSGPLRAWLAQRQRSVEDAEAAYLEVLTVQPEAPPRWVVASAARAAQLWLDYAEDYAKVKAAVLDGIIVDEAERAKWWALAGPSSEPRIDHARALYQRCRSVAERYRVEDTFSQRCTAWLAAHP